MKSFKNLIVLIFNLLFSIIGFGQDFSTIYKGKEDSLISVINNPKTNDTSLLAAQLIVAELLITNNGNRESAKLYIEKTIAMADKFLKKNPTPIVRKAIDRYAANAIFDLNNFTTDIKKRNEYFELAVKRAPFDTLLVQTAAGDILSYNANEKNLKKCLEFLNIINKQGVKISVEKLVLSFNKAVDITSNQSIDSVVAVLKLLPTENKKYEDMQRKTAIVLLEQIRKKSSDETVISEIRKLYTGRKDNFELWETIGLFYLNKFDRMGEETTPIRYLFLNLFEELGHKKDLANVNAELGKNFRNQKLYDRAIFHLKAAYKYAVEINDTSEIMFENNLIASTYNRMGYWDSTLATTKIGLELAFKNNNKLMIARSYNEAGTAHYGLGEYNLALKEQKESYRFYKISGYPKNLFAPSTLQIARCYLALHQLDSAKNYGLLSIELIKGFDKDAFVTNAYLIMSDIYAARKEWSDAYKMYKKHIQISEELSNSEIAQKLVASNLNHNFEQKQLLQKEEQKLKNELAKKDLKQKNIILGFISVGAILLVLVIAFVINRLRITRKQKNEIDKQKHLVEEKNKEILDSINYAERIQRTFLASKDVLDVNLQDYFILFKPKDVVSGDFYWANKLPNGNFAIVTADSTGHGVPGAIMSLLNITSIEKAIEQNKFLPNDILNHTRNTIIERLKKDGSSEGGKDGMDCSLCVYDFKNMKLFVSSAHNPVWIIRTQSSLEFIEINPDKMPVGKHDKQDTSFTLNEVELQKGDIIYTLTDGFPDQFGGARGKKFMIKRLRELIVENAHLPMTEQKQFLEKTFSDWVGELEQIDDVTVIGIKI